MAKVESTSTVRLEDIERMLAEHAKTREHLVALVRSQIDGRARDLPRLQKMLEDLTGEA